MMFCFFYSSPTTTGLWEAFGAVGIKLSNETTEEIHAKMAEAQKASQNGKPVVVNCLIGRTDFRNGSVSV